MCFIAFDCHVGSWPGDANCTGIGTIVADGASRAIVTGNGTLSGSGIFEVPTGSFNGSGSYLSCVLYLGNACPYKVGVLMLQLFKH